MAQLSVHIKHFPRKSRPTSGIAVTLKTGRREMPGLNPSRACRLSRSEFLVIFSETLANAGSDPSENPPRKELLWQV